MNACSRAQAPTEWRERFTPLIFWNELRCGLLRRGTRVGWYVMLQVAGRVSVHVKVLFQPSAPNARSGRDPCNVDEPNFPRAPSVNQRRPVFFGI
jgi:hypothetical protein